LAHNLPSRDYTQLRLDSLPSASAEEFLAALLGDAASLTPLTRLLIARTEGNPFFLEESVRALAETGVLGGTPGAYRLIQPLQGMPVPATVQAVLAARIDRLPPEDKHLLQTTAVIGTDVPFILLRTIADMAEETLHRGLAHLQAAEFLYETRLFPEPEYTFKHALTHEVGYSGLLLERRRALHAGIVAASERLYADRLSEQVERLAQHAFRGEVWDKAVTYCRQAGTRAFTRSAFREAVACFEQALAALQHRPERRDTIEQAIDLRFDLRNALQQLFDRGPILELLEHLRQAETLAQALGDQHRLGRVLSYMTRHFWDIVGYDRAIVAGERALAIAAALGDVGLQAVTQCFLGQIYHFLGDYGRALDILRRNVASLEGELCYERFGLPVPASVYSRTWLVASLAELGAFAEGIAHCEEQVRITASDDHPVSLVHPNFNLGRLALRQGDLPQAIAVLERGVGLCQTWDIRAWFPNMASHLGYAYALAGRIAEALPLLEQAEQRGAARGTMGGGYSLNVGYVSEAYLLAGRREEAVQHAGRALDLSRARKERGHEAWVLRLLGEIAARREPPESALAEAYYQQALTLAEELGMRPLQAHCHRGLGTLYTTTGQHEQARTALSTAIALYRDMDMTFWLPQTEAALAQVEGR
jgi:predicted ATPase